MKQSLTIGASPELVFVMLVFTLFHSRLSVESVSQIHSRFTEPAECLSKRQKTCRKRCRKLGISGENTHGWNISQINYFERVPRETEDVSETLLAAFFFVSLHEVDFLMPSSSKVQKIQKEIILFFA